MNRLLTILLIIVAAPTVLYGQHLQSVDRQRLDAKVNPQVSTEAKGALRAERSTIEIGAIEDMASVTESFRLTNTTATTIAITEIRSTCSCLKVETKPRSIASGESIDIVAHFNPEGRSGTFSLNILVYTSLDATLPTERLTLTGEVVCGDDMSHLPIRMGELRLSRNSVTLDSSTRTERIAVANVGDRNIRLSASSTANGLSLHTEPEVLMPGDEGDIVISYTPTAFTTDFETMLIIEGCGGRPSERVIKITIKR